MIRTRSIALTAALLALAVMLAVAGCAQPQASIPAATGATSTTVAKFPVTLTDDASRTVTIAEKPTRIVSLAPANTEILFAIGAGDRVVGVTTYDDYPPQVKKLPKVGDFTNPNLEAIAALKPDLIVATTGVQTQTLAKLRALGATVIAIDPQSLDAAMIDIGRLGQATGQGRYADGVVSDMRAAINEIQAKIAGKTRPTVFLEIGQNPLYTVGEGTLLGDLIDAAGGRNVVTQSGYVPYSAEALLKANPDVYIATKGSSSDPAAIQKRPGFSALAAVKNGRVYVVDDSLVSRPGPRIVQGLRQIAVALYPDAFAQ